MVRAGGAITGAGGAVVSGGRDHGGTLLIHPQAHPPHGREGYGQGAEGFKNLVSAWRTSFPDLIRSVEDIVAEANTVVLHFAIKGTHTGAGGIVPSAPTGQVWEISGVTAFRFVDGKIFDEPWAFNNVAEAPTRPNAQHHPESDGRILAY